MSHEYFLFFYSTASLSEELEKLSYYMEQDAMISEYRPGEYYADFHESKFSCAPSAIYSKSEQKQRIKDKLGLEVNIEIRIPQEGSDYVYEETMIFQGVFMLLCEITGDALFQYEDHLLLLKRGENFIVNTEDWWRNADLTLLPNFEETNFSGFILY